MGKSLGVWVFADPVPDIFFEASACDGVIGWLEACASVQFFEASEGVSPSSE